MMTEEELAYLAGIVDALAIIRVREVGETKLIYVAISSADFRLLDQFAQATGTKITTVNRKYNRVGCSTHCDEPHLHVQSVTGRWSVSGIKATVMLRALLPYLRLKASEARVMIDAYGSAPFKPHVFDKMIQLGWPDVIREERQRALEKNQKRVPS